MVEKKFFFSMKTKFFMRTIKEHDFDKNINIDENKKS